MKLTALFDQTMTLYYNSKGNASIQQRDKFIRTLATVYWEAGWEDSDESKYYSELKNAAMRAGFSSVDSLKKNC